MQAAYREWANFRTWHALFQDNPQLGPGGSSQDTLQLSIPSAAPSPAPAPAPTVTPTMQPAANLTPLKPSLCTPSSSSSSTDDDEENDAYISQRQIQQWEKLVSKSRPGDTPLKPVALKRKWTPITGTSGAEGELLFAEESSADEDELSFFEKQTSGQEIADTRQEQPKKPKEQAGKNKKDKKQTRHTKQQATLETTMAQFSAIVQSSSATEMATTHLLAEVETKKEEDRRKWEFNMELDRQKYEEKLLRERRQYEEEKERDRKKYEEDHERERREYEERKERERLEYEEKREQERQDRDDRRWRMDKQFMADLLSKQK